MCPKKKGAAGALAQTTKILLPTLGIAYLADKVKVAPDNLNYLFWFGVYGALIFYDEYSSNIPETDPVVMVPPVQREAPSLAELGIH